MKFLFVFWLVQLDLVLGHVPSHRYRTNILDDSSDDIDAILSGVNKFIAPRGSGFSDVLCMTSSSFPLIAGPLTDKVNAPVAAGGRMGKGRIIAGGHTTFLETSKDTSMGDNDKFLLNSLRWLAAARTKPVSGDVVNVGRYRLYDDTLQEFLTKNSFKSSAISDADLQSIDSLKKFDVLIIQSSGKFYKNDKSTKNLIQFVENGGGILMANTGWAWNSVDIRLANRLTSGAGIVWGTSGVSHNNKAGQYFDVSRSLLENTHTGELVGKIFAFLKGKNSDLDVESFTGYTRMIDEVVESLPEDDQTFVATLKKNYLDLNLPPVIPTEKRPIKKGTDKISLLMYDTYSGLLKPEEIKAHPASDIFPGKCPQNARETKQAASHVVYFNITHRAETAGARSRINSGFGVTSGYDKTLGYCGRENDKISGKFESDEIFEKLNQNINVDPKVKDWHSTGLYAPAGQLIKIQFDYGSSLNGFNVLIGSHTDDLRKLDSWSRCPRVTIQKPVLNQQMTIASPYGGLIYVVVPSNAAGGSMKVTIDGAVQAPYFVLGQTSNSDWNKIIKNYDGPWAEFESRDMVLTVKTEHARKVDDPEGLMTYWNVVMDAYATLVDIDVNRPSPMRMCSDVQISVGYMHSGYPMMTELPEGMTTTSVAKLKQMNAGNTAEGWGQYHEVGHNHQDGMWTWDGLGEVTNNLMVLYIYETIIKVDYQTARDSVTVKDRQARAKKFIADGKKFDTFKDDPWLPLSHFIQLQKKFGWDFYKKVFANYHKLSNSDKDVDDDGKRDLWVVMASKVAGENLFPFYRSWNIPLKEEVEDKLKGLPLTSLRIDDIFKE